MKKVMFLDRYNLTQAVIDGRKTMTRRNIPKDFFTQVWDVRDDTLVYEDDYGDFIESDTPIIINTEFVMWLPLRKAMKVYIMNKGWKQWICWFVV